MQTAIGSGRIATAGINRYPAWKNDHLAKRPLTVSLSVRIIT